MESGEVATEAELAAAKQIVGYCEPLSLRAGGVVSYMASSHTPGEVALDVVQIICGDPTRSGPGFDERVVETDLPATLQLVDQPITPGSYGEVSMGGVAARSELRLKLHVMATRPTGLQTVATVVGDDGEELLSVRLAGGELIAESGTARIRLRERAVTNRRWYAVDVGLDLERGILSGRAVAEGSHSPGRDLLEPAPDVEESEGASNGGPLSGLMLAASPGGERFDGRIARPLLQADDSEFVWDLSRDMAGRSMVEVSGQGRHGELHQLPARGVTGPGWDGTTQRWTDDPGQWDAVHFHHDDLYDAGWPAVAQFTVPADLPSGIYAFRVIGGAGEDRVPFFVRPGADVPTADIALLMPSATYMAYANHRTLIDGADFMGARTRLRPEHDYVRLHPEIGRSHYEKHPDGSGVMYSSRNRPVLQLRPGADGWNFTPDTDLNAFLHHLEVGHDIISDEDLHADGIAALTPYRVIVTGTHPEYWSTAMLDALEAWQRSGGRLMYLGGNGFYWRVAFSDAWPGAMELRRAEDGVRNWQTEAGESYHSWGGEYGGLWRRNGRAPNELAGVGFAAQGFDKATHYVRSDEALESRAAWVLEGVEDRLIGTSGLGGGAAGQEIDRFDERLGSPGHAVILASATSFGTDMLRTKEEFEASIAFPSPDPYVRADMVFFETQAGGAVFSVSSISWFGALARNGYDNDVSRITENVVRRFLDPAPFPLPEG